MLLLNSFMPAIRQRMVIYNFTVNYSLDALVCYLHDHSIFSLLPFSHPYCLLLRRSLYSNFLRFSEFSSTLNPVFSNSIAASLCQRLTFSAMHFVRSPHKRAPFSTNSLSSFILLRFSCLFLSFFFME